MKERLMIIHTAIYLTYIISNFLVSSTKLLSKKKFEKEDYTTACRLQFVERIANDALWLTISATVLLQSYMCNKFSLPVKDSQ